MGTRELDDEIDEKSSSLSISTLTYSSTFIPRDCSILSHVDISEQ